MAVTSDYQMYLQNKFQLNNTAIKDINWTTMALAIRHLTMPDQTCIHKFIHDWLPLKGAQHTASACSSDLCPHCHHKTKNTWHFLECQHPNHNIRFLKLHADITQLHATRNINPH